MIKTLLSITFLLSTLYAIEIPVHHAKVRKFGRSVELNAQVVQLSNAKQSIMSMVSGHIEKYYVKPAQKVRRGDKVALIESIMLSRMTAEYVSLQEQYQALNKNYEATKKLYDKGMTSQQELNDQSIKRDAMRSQIDALRSQLSTLGIRTKRVKKASADYILYAHSDGKVAEILQPLHSVISEDTPIVNIVKRHDSYIRSFLPLEFAGKVRVGQRVVVDYGKKKIMTHVTQIMPEVDQTTQRIVLLSSIDDKKEELFINAYVGATLCFDAAEEHVAVEKSALSFFNNEWVVFVPVAEGEGESAKREEEDHDEHEEVPYEARVVEIVTEDEAFAAVKGLEEGEEYVSAKSYYVKSMMLKSSLGEHGH